MSENKTIVGVPFYESEGQECLNVTLRNIDDRLNELNVDASIMVQVNGPDTSRGVRPDLAVEQSAYNAAVELVRSRRLGQTYAMDDMLAEASRRMIQRMFLTDADIFRMPESLKSMWEHDTVVVGARYRPYPVEIVEAEFGKLTYEERLLYQIFDGDQTPQARQILREHGIDRKDWVKASLMLVDVESGKKMHGGQSHTTDSVMNRVLAEADLEVDENARFMHMGRVDMGDHIKARLRHFKAASARGELHSFLHKEVQLPDEAKMNQVAEDIRQSCPRGDFLAMLYLLRCAVRERVNEICLGIASHTWDPASLGELNPISMQEVKTFAYAKIAIQRFFLDVDWDDIDGTSVGPPPVTQERLRRPFNMEPYLSNSRLAQIALSSFGQLRPANAGD